MLAHPEDQAGILAVPAVAHVVREEAPRVPVVLIAHQDADTARLAGVGLHVLLPDHRQKQGTSRVHNRDVREEPMAVIRLQQLNRTQEEGVLGNRSHGVVGDTGRNSATDPGRVGEERI